MSDYVYVKDDEGFAVVKPTNELNPNEVIISKREYDKICYDSSDIDKIVIIGITSTIFSEIAWTMLSLLSKYNIWLLTIPLMIFILIANFYMMYKALNKGQ